LEKRVPSSTEFEIIQGDQHQSTCDNHRDYTDERGWFWTSTMCYFTHDRDEEVNGGKSDKKNAWWPEGHVQSGGNTGEGSKYCGRS
jgi:hypothetical protein